MKKFDESDLIKYGVGTENENTRIWAEKEDFVIKQLWFHKQNLMQTSTGYGAKLVTENMIWFENRLRRIYCTIYSNNGTCWFIYKGKKIIVE